SDIVNLAGRILADFHGSVHLSTLDTSISLYREDIAASPLHHDYVNSRVLRQLANALLIRFRITGNINEVRESISLLRRLRITQPDHNQLMLGLLWMAFNLFGDEGKLHSAIVSLEAAATQMTWGHPNRTETLRNFTTALHTRFAAKGSPEDPDRAIKLRPETLDLCPVPHTGRGTSINNLAIVLPIRFQARGDPQDLDRAVVLLNEALELYPAPDPDREYFLSNLGVVLDTRWR
ncbi:hypothetical protein DFH09DRAFT_886416, partial [Mycena vulgaris]